MFCIFATVPLRLSLKKVIYMKLCIIYAVYIIELYTVLFIYFLAKVRRF